MKYVFKTTHIIIHIMIMIMNLPPHSASSLVVVVVITLFPSDATQLRSLMGQVEPRNTFIVGKYLILGYLNITTNKMTNLFAKCYILLSAKC